MCSLLQVLLFLEQSNCLYVWIDHLSVPQEKKYRRMSRLLLSRMMAVYASAGITLALRSIEIEHSRYHQRGESAFTPCHTCMYSRVHTHTRARAGEQQQLMMPPINHSPCL